MVYRGGWSGGLSWGRRSAGKRQSNEPGANGEKADSEKQSCVNRSAVCFRVCRRAKRCCTGTASNINNKKINKAATKKAPKTIACFCQDDVEDEIGYRIITMFCLISSSRDTRLNCITVSCKNRQRVAFFFHSLKNTFVDIFGKIKK